MTFVEIIHEPLTQDTNWFGMLGVINMITFMELLRSSQHIQEPLTSMNITSTVAVLFLELREWL